MKTIATLKAIYYQKAASHRHEVLLNLIADGAADLVVQANQQQAADLYRLARAWVRIIADLDAGHPDRARSLQLLTFDQTDDYDHLNFRVIPFISQDGEPLYTLVEEKMKASRVVADKRRWLTAEQIKNLADAINGSWK